MNAHSPVRALLLAALLALPISARAAELSVPGVPNFHQVAGHLFRGGQPSSDAWPHLARLGVRTVIDLRRESEHSTAAEAHAVEAAGMRYVSFPMNGFETPTSAQIGKVLALLGAEDTVFVHCKLGMDRTGTVMAAYRIARDRWANDKALDEAQSLGLHWYEFGMKRFIRGYKFEEPAELARASTDEAAAVAPVAVPTEH